MIITVETHNSTNDSTFKKYREKLSFEVEDDTYETAHDFAELLQRVMAGMGYGRSSIEDVFCTEGISCEENDKLIEENTLLKQQFRINEIQGSLISDLEEQLKSQLDKISKLERKLNKIKK